MADDDTGPTAQDNQLLRERAAELVQQRATLVPALTAFVAELPSGRKRHQLSGLLSKLESGATPEELCQTKGCPASWVPLLAGTAPIDSKNYFGDLFTAASRDSALLALRVRNYAYPLMGLLMALAILALLAVAVVPGFHDIFTDFGLDLPQVTVSLLWLSQQLTEHALRTLLLFCVLVLVGYLALRLFWLLRVPSRIVDTLTRGSSRQVTTMGVFVQQLVDLSKAGLPLAASLRLAAEQSDSSWLREDARRLAHRLEHPTQDSDSPWQSNLPPTVVYALSAGQEGQPNLPLLETMAEVYAERIRGRFDWTSGVLPQLGMLAVGLVVAYVVLALFLPLISLINGLTG